MNRDFQRSRVYAWERSIPGLRSARGVMSIEEAAEMVRRIWRKERGRYGRARQVPPLTVPGRGGGRAYGSSKIQLGVWARQPAVILHELAHCLARQGERHGPRFVGIVVGLYARHLGLDRDELLAAAEEHGVQFAVNSVGTTPKFGMGRKILRALSLNGGRVASEIELAVMIGCGYRAVRGGLLTLRRSGAITCRGRSIALSRGAA